MKFLCRAVLFDMDGTLVDSTLVVERTWRRWAERHAIPADEVLRFSHGRPTNATLEHFLPGQDHAAELEEMGRFEESELNEIVPVPGADAAVRSVMNGPWAIVTSAWRKLAVARVLGAGLPLPEVLVPVDEIEHGKPDPEGYLTAASRLGVAPKDCLVFEDTRPGIEAGLNAGMNVVGLLTTVPAEQLAHQPLIRDFRQMRAEPRGTEFEIEIAAEPT
ncbi:MAG: HAD-IA family hydrolase [Bryobacteraceae bacterium]